MEAIVDRTSRTVTVRMSTRRWNRMLELEQTYKLARIIKRSMKQVEEEQSAGMSALTGGLGGMNGLGGLGGLSF